jgi:putative ABC transport system permease protein
MHYQNKKLGFDKDHVLVMTLRGDAVEEESVVLKEKLQNTSGISNVSISSNFPGAGASEGHGFFPEGFSEEKPWLMKTMGIDTEFIETFGLKLKEGRNFSTEYENEGRNVIVNETLVKDVGWEDPIGKTFKDPFVKENDEMVPVTIIGVVEDFHVNPLRDKIEPMTLNYAPDYRNFISVRIEPTNVFAVLDKIENEWKEMFPNMPFDYSFLDEHFNEIHKQERNLATTFMYFTFLAIVIASLGLFGLASYATERRIKEIGVRKVMGSSVGEIILLLSKDFTRLVIIANIVAWPITWFTMNKWLQNFAYRTEIGLGVFIISGFIALIIALFTVSFRTIKAANANPVDALIYE